MKSIRQLLSRFRKPPVIRTVIDGKPEVVTEWCRRQAAANMKLEPETKAKVEALLKERYGEVEGMKIARRNYPEAYE